MTGELLSTLTSHPLAGAFTLALLHSLWQGAAVALALAVALAVLRGRSHVGPPPLSAAGLTDALQPWLVPLWLAGVLMLSLRFAGGWIQLQRLRTRDVGLPRVQLRSAAARLARRMGVRRAVDVLESARVAGPLTLG